MFAYRHLIWQIGLTVFAIWQLDGLIHWPQPVQILLPFAPYLVASLGIFISLYLNRLQPVLIFLTLISVNVAIGYLLPEGTSLLKNLSAQTLYPLVSILLPLNLLLWAWVPERGIHHKVYVLSLLALFALQGYGVFWLMENLPLNTLVFISQPIQGVSLVLPKVPLVVILLVWLVMMMHNAWRGQIRILDQTLVFVLVLMAFGLNAFEVPHALSWITTVSAVLVLLSLVFDAHRIAYTDQLTGLQGRRALLESFLGLGRKYSIAMMDIDHFKSFNDRYGHDIGDDVLKTVARELSYVSLGKPYRYGGEEFTIVFPRKSVAEAKQALETVRQQIESVPLEVKENGEPATTKVTVSFGLAERGGELKTPQTVLKAADMALYQAKEAGRNCTVVYGENPTPPKKGPPRSQSKSTVKRARKKTP